MAMSQNTEVINGKNTTASAAAKRRTPRKSAGQAARPRKAAASAEILFTQAANPYQTPVPPYIWIDHPGENETLLGPVYVIRLGVGGADSVEISIDKGAWQSCRPTSGYWWYDWKDIPRGKHTLAARMRTGQGQWYRTPPRTCAYR